MSAAPIEFIAPGASLEQVMQSAQRAGGVGDSPAASDFASWMGNYVDSLNQNLVEADRLTASLVSGRIDNLHHVMIGLQESKLAFQLAVQVRNRILDAYQEISKIQL